MEAALPLPEPLIVVPERASALLAEVGIELLCGICRGKAAKRRVDSWRMAWLLRPPPLGDGSR
jgi:hypothetical protein